MPYVAYNRPISKVGHRLLNQTSPARAAALSGIGTLGDDTSTLMLMGFTSPQIAQIISARNAGALSDQGYQYILTGSVDPSDLANFLQGDVGGPTTTSGGLIPGIPNWGLVAGLGLLLVVAFIGRR